MSELVVPPYDCGMTDERNLAGEPYAVDSDFRIGVVPYDYASVHQKPIAFGEHGLFDPRSLLPYMTKDHCQDLVTPRLPESCKLEFHHGLFPKKEYKKKIAFALKRVRNSRYNQFLMWSCQEDLFHQDSATEVRVDDLSVEAAERFIEEEEALNDYAAGSLALAEAQDAMEGVSSSTMRMKKAMLAANLALHQEIAEETEQGIYDIEVMSFEVVTGALLAYFNRQPEAGMSRIIAKRLKENPIAIATRGYSEGHLRDASRKLLDRKVSGSAGQLRNLIEVAKAA